MIGRFQNILELYSDKTEKFSEFRREKLAHFCQGVDRSQKTHKFSTFGGVASDASLDTLTTLVKIL